MIDIITGASSKSHNGLVLIQIKMVSDKAHREETTWAKPLGNDLYEIKYPLHLITGFNVGDVVKAITTSSDMLPSVLELVKESGQRTLHILFSEGVSTLARQSVLNKLGTYSVIYETAFDRFYTIEVSTDGIYKAICAYLKSLSHKGVLMFEPEIDIDKLHSVRVLGTGII